MSYYNTAPSLTRGGIMFSFQVQPHVLPEGDGSVFAAHIGAIDAPDYMPAGSCKKFRCGSFDLPYQVAADRSLLDAYEYTDATAKHTDCASEAI